MRDVVGGRSERAPGTDAPASVPEAPPEPAGSPHPPVPAVLIGNVPETSAGATAPAVTGATGALDQVLRSLAAAEATAAKILADVQAQTEAWARQPPLTVSTADPAAPAVALARADKAPAAAGAEVPAGDAEEESPRSAEVEAPAGSSRAGGAEAEGESSRSAEVEAPAGPGRAEEVPSRDESAASAVPSRGGFRRVPAVPNASTPRRTGAPGPMWWAAEPTAPAVPAPAKPADPRELVGRAEVLAPAGRARAEPAGRAELIGQAEVLAPATPARAEPVEPVEPVEGPGPRPAPPPAMGPWVEPGGRVEALGRAGGADQSATPVQVVGRPEVRDAAGMVRPGGAYGDDGGTGAEGTAGPAQDPGPPGRPGLLRRVRHRWAVGPLVALAVVTGVCTAAVPMSTEHGRWGDFATTSTGLARSSPAETRRLADVRMLLDARAAALLHRNGAGWLAGVDPAARGLRAQQAALFTNIAAVPLAGWRYEIEPEHERGRAEPAGSRWTVQVTLHYALRAADPAPTARPLVLTFARRGDRWLLAADDATADGTRTWRGPWEYGPLVARRGKYSLVLAHPRNAQRLAAFAAGVDAAVPRVRQVIGGKWSGPVAVLIPDDQREMSQLVGERLALGKIAAVAVADSVDPRSGQARGQRVVINPANLDRLGPLGRRVVLQHEVAHVATRGFTGPGTPIWLVEGLADWVGYLDSELPPRLVGDELRTLLRSGRWPGRLPTAADFRGDSPRLSVAYEEAWSACRLIAERAGPAALVRLYRAVGTAGDPTAAVDAQLRRTLGLSYAQFVVEWRRSVRADFG
jgi:hypothetical protein